MIPMLQVSSRRSLPKGGIRASLKGKNWKNGKKLEKIGKN